MKSDTVSDGFPIRFIHFDPIPPNNERQYQLGLQLNRALGNSGALPGAKTSTLMVTTEPLPSLKSVFISPSFLDLIEGKEPIRFNKVSE